jgi:hypothetical protein
MPANVPPIGTIPLEATFHRHIYIVYTLSRRRLSNQDPRELIDPLSGELID